MPLQTSLDSGSSIVPAGIAAQNLSAWSSPSSDIITSHGVRSPIGTGTVYGLTSSGTTSYITEGISSLTAGDVFSWRLWLKKGAGDWVRLRVRDNATDYYVSINLAVGAIGADYSSGLHVRVTPMGDGWHMVTVLRVMVATSVNLYIYAAEGNGDIVFSSTPSGTRFYAWNNERGQW